MSGIGQRARSKKSSFCRPYSATYMVQSQELIERNSPTPYTQYPTPLFS
ncbi:hypothetical protein FDUTEX481_06305 [Tolypothrix sp. PCC 7601]|nr:hypothetical protein FDUTEX481_06305 [Tolypothrix sp. PCC 7601]